MVNLYEWANEKGYKIAWCSIKVLDEIRLEMSRRGANNEFHPAQRVYLENLPYDKDIHFTGAKTVIIISYKRSPAYRVYFQLEDSILPTLLPPGYFSHKETEKQVLDDVESVIIREGGQIGTLKAPLKNLAVRLGLAVYGRNNLTYIDGMGSYHRLLGFVTDVEFKPSSYPDKKSDDILHSCRTCKICQKACPTGAIGEDRFLLHVERCITLYNEETWSWPAWLPMSAHNCLIGCILCQEACTHNTGLLEYVEDKSFTFTYDETMFLLSNTDERNGPIWESIRNKLNIMGISDYTNCISRNLKALVDKYRMNC